MRIEMPAIVGWGHSSFGKHEQLTLEDLINEVTVQALTCCGLSGKDVDGLFLGHFNAGMAPDGFASSLLQQTDPALRFTPATRYENACASGSAAIYAAMQALAAGSCRMALVVGVEKMSGLDRDGVTKALGSAGYQNDPDEARLSFPDVFATYATAYARRYDDPLDAMAMIAAKNHANAFSNPYAQLKKELDFEFCRTVSDKNPLIAPPLRLSDCSLVSDGAAAIVLTKADIATSFDKAVKFRAAAHVSDSLPLASRDFLSFEGPRRAFANAYENAAIDVDDLDFAEVHDCFTIAELLTYEAMGLARPGQGRSVLEDGKVMKGGELPVNLSGGLKAKGHPVGATGVSMHVLSFLQLTGQAGQMQQENAVLGAVFNMGGAGVANYVSVLETMKA